eukprot:5101315-Pyramimonas_sp.AAC.1
MQHAGEKAEADEVEEEEEEDEEQAEEEDIELDMKGMMTKMMKMMKGMRKDLKGYEEGGNECQRRRTAGAGYSEQGLSLIHISEPTRPEPI